MQLVLLLRHLSIDSAKRLPETPDKQTLLTHLKKYLVALLLSSYFVLHFGDFDRHLVELLWSKLVDIVALSFHDVFYAVRLDALTDQP
jgi:hypothetical protein